MTEQMMRLQMWEMDCLCQGIGAFCMQCANPLPKQGKRVCPTVSAETCHQIARKLRRSNRD